MALSLTDLNKIYLAYFGRPVDASGLSTFSNMEIGNVIGAFDSSKESQDLYGTDPVAKINAIYQNLFGRDAEPEGLKGWLDRLATGEVTPASAALEILKRAQNSDAVAVANKVAAADAFTNEVLKSTTSMLGYSGNAAAEAARNWLSKVNAESDMAMVTAEVAAAVTSVATNGGVEGETFTLTKGADTFNGTSGNDTFTAADTADGGAVGTTWTVGDKLDGGAGTDQLDVTSTAAIALPTGATVTNIETVNLLSGATITIDTTTGFAGLTTLNATSKNGATTNTTLTAAATTDISSTESNIGVVGTGGQLVINGGKNVTVSATGTTNNSGGTAFNAGTGAGAEILVGATTAAAGTVNVTNSFKGANSEISGDVFVKGGTEVTVTQKTTNTTVGETNAQGQVAVVGTAATTKVTVNQDKTVGASTTGTGLVGKTAGAVTITDVNSASATAAGTITTVSLTNAGAANINSGALSTLNLGGSLTTVDASLNTALTTGQVNTLALNLTGAESTGAVTIDADVKTLNISGNTTASTLNSLVASGATKINVSGDAKVTLTGNTTAAVTDIVVTNTAGASFGTALGTAVNFTGGAGDDSIKLTANFTKAITMGDGNDTVTYAAQGTGGSVDAGNGTGDKIIMANNDAASADDDSTFNSKFKNFEVLEISNAFTEDALNLSGINGVSKVILAAGVNGTAGVNNLASGGTVEIKADGANTAALSVGVKDALLNENDTLNLVLTKTGGVLAVGSVTAAGVENISISAADANTKGSTANINTLTLVAADAKAVTVTGNNGLTITNDSTNKKITSFDASGVVANNTVDGPGVAATTDSAANLAVTFLSANNTATDTVTIKGGAGNDVLSGNIAKDTISGGAGADYIYGDNAGTNRVENFVVTGTTASETVKVTIFGIEVSATTGASADATVTNLIAAINGKAELKGLVTSEVGGTTATLKLNYLVDGDTAAATTDSANVTFAAASGVTSGTAGTVAIDSLDGGAGADLIVGGGGADSLTGGDGADTFFMLKGHSNKAALATITDYTYAVGGTSNDKLILGDVTTAAGTVTKVQDLSAQASLDAAFDAAALGNSVNNGLVVFIHGGNTYAYVETSGATSTYTAGDFAVKLVGTPIAADTALAGLGFDAV